MSSRAGRYAPQALIQPDQHLHIRILHKIAKPNTSSGKPAQWARDQHSVDVSVSAGWLVALARYEADEEQQGTPYGNCSTIGGQQGCETTNERQVRDMFWNKEKEKERLFHLAERPICFHQKTLWGASKKWKKGTMALNTRRLLKWNK